MKSKNTFKPSDIKYDPIRQAKQPLWMHSIDKPVSKNEEKEIIKSFILFIFLGILTALLYIILEG